MKIVLITGSPRKKGTSNLLAEHFIKGAEDAGKVLALGCYGREDIEKTDYPNQAYLLGKNLV